MEDKIAIIIPARLASTRLPNKALANILGKTMIRRVYEKAMQVDGVKVFVACDNKEVLQEIENHGGVAILTDPNLPSGTDRVYAASKLIDEDFDVIVNLQGDLPNIDPAVINSAIEALKNSDADIATVASIITEKEEIKDPNVVKIAISFSEGDRKSGNALYFSRCPIPYDKNQSVPYYHHVGIYAYKREALEKFVALNPSILEKQESLEQLRALENNMKIAVQIVDSNPLSVDTREDLLSVIKLISGKK